MADIIRTTTSKYRDDSSSDDDRSHGRSREYTTTRYRVTPSRVEKVEDNNRIIRSERLEVGPRGVELDRRVERVDRDSDRIRTVVARPRSYVEPERERQRERDREVSRTVLNDRDGRDRDLVARGWERESDRMERTWDRERDTDLRIERRTRDSPYEVERYQRETEYYTRPDQIIVRKPSPEPQRNAEKPRNPLNPRDERGYAMIRRDDPEPRELAYPREEYYRREVRDVPPQQEMLRYDRREIRRQSVSSDGYGSDGSETVVRTRKVTRERGRSHSPHHKLHLAEGALAGAGAAAIIAHHRSKSGAPQRTAPQVAGGAALGAIGAELVTRARSHYRDRSRNRSRSRSSSRHSHSKVKTGLGVAALAIAAAAAGKYLVDRNTAKKEEAGRGRSRARSASRNRRYSTDDEGANNRNTSRNRVATIAKAGAGAAAVAGIVEAIRSKSQQRKGGRSRSALRTGGAIAATGLAGAAVASLYEARKKNQDKKDERNRGRNSQSRSLSRPRSLNDPAIDPEMGMVEYGANPVHHETNTYSRHYDPAIAAPPDPRYDSQERSRSRSRSRVRNLAAPAAAGGATVYGVEQLYQQRKERKALERERRRYEEEASGENYYANDSYDDGYSPSPPRASGGALYPDAHSFPQQPTGHVQQTTTTTTTHNNEPLQQPPLPNDLHGNQPPPHDPYGYPPTGTRAAENVSNTSLPPHSHRNIHEEDRLTNSTSIDTPSYSSSPPLAPSDAPHNRSVTFAPLSPESSRRLAQTKTRQRRNSDPSSDRFNLPSTHRRRARNSSRSPSPDSDVEELPDRFDPDGRPLDGSSRSRGMEHDVTQRIVHDFEDVLEGRQSWKDLLRDVLEEAVG